ncbi:Mercuric reductase [bacterium HR21]|nr:Mercuric reductase [bacterium HR21]
MTPRNEAAFAPFSPHSAVPFDLIIIGGGAAAFSAAIRADELGARTLMLNDGLPLGGTCVNVGCVPSKYLLQALKQYRHLQQRTAKPWLRGREELELDYAQLVDTKEELVNALRRRNYEELLGRLRMVTFRAARARLLGQIPSAPAVASCCSVPESDFLVAAGGELFRSPRLLIATGARTFVPPIPGLEAVRPLTHQSALSLRTPPRSLVILGAGPMGLEFAQLFRRAGSEVTVIELQPRILPQHDSEIAQSLQQHLEAEGIRFLLGIRLERVEGTPGNVRVIAGGEILAEAEQILVATGIRANTDGLGLETVGVLTDERGFIRTDARQETSVAGIYAAGDVTGRMPLETVAARQGWNAAHNALTGDSRSLRYELVPHAVFTDPEVAAIGMTEDDGRAQGSYSCVRLSLENVPRALTQQDTRGFVKLVVDSSGKLCGAHALAAHASELIHIPLLAMAAGMRVEELVELVYVFPTYSEAWKIAAQSRIRPLERMSCCVL